MEPLRSTDSHTIPDFLHNSGTDARYREQIIGVPETAAPVAKLHDPRGEFWSDSRQAHEILDLGPVQIDQ